MSVGTVHHTSLPVLIIVPCSVYCQAPWFSCASDGYLCVEVCFLLLSSKMTRGSNDKFPIVFAKIINMNEFTVKCTST